MSVDNVRVVRVGFFKPGTSVIYKNKNYTVDHVRISGHDLWIKLDHYPDFVNALDLQVEITEILFQKD